VSTKRVLRALSPIGAAVYSATSGFRCRRGELGDWVGWAARFGTTRGNWADIWFHRLRSDRVELAAAECSRLRLVLVVFNSNSVLYASEDCSVQ